MGKFRIKVKANARKDEIKIMEDGTVKVFLKVFPKEGKANKYLIKFLAEKMKIPKKQIKIIFGEHSKNKIIQIEGIEKFPPIKRARK